MTETFQMLVEQIRHRDPEMEQIEQHKAAATSQRELEMRVLDRTAELTKTNQAAPSIDGRIAGRSLLL